MYIKKRVDKIKNKCGFTLLELMIVLGIVGILATFAIPSIVNIYNIQAEQSTATQFLNAFKMARQQAISTHNNVSIDIVDNNADGKFDELIVKNVVDNSIMIKQPIYNKFKYSIVGIRKQAKITRAESFVYNSAGLPYFGTTPLDNSQVIVIAFSHVSMQGDMTIALNNPNLIGFIADSIGLAYICKNTIDGQVTQKCNG